MVDNHPDQSPLIPPKRGIVRLPVGEIVLKYEHIGLDFIAISINNYLFLNMDLATHTDGHIFFACHEYVDV